MNFRLNAAASQQRNTAPVFRGILFLSSRMRSPIYQFMALCDLPMKLWIVFTLQ
jgi:hypothetical protein